MDAAFYDRMGALVDVMVGKFMADAMLSTASSPASYDPRTGKAAPSINSNRRIQAVRGSRNTTDDDGVMVRQTFALMVERPTIGDSLTIGNRTYRVVSVEDVAPIGVSYFYRAILA